MYNTYMYVCINKYKYVGIPTNTYVIDAIVLINVFLYFKLTIPYHFWDIHVNVKNYIYGKKGSFFLDYSLLHRNFNNFHG